ncbi:MAG TPA: Do family serine endopeptidase [Candidatus Polarisedimenticolia bacterium]|nr:Do family serine endopeptidase [Candidatus Polarisedimenticolia bacterium]
MKKHAQLLILAVIAGGSILFGMVLASGVKLTPSTMADSSLKPISLRQSPAPSGGVSSSRVGYPSFADIVETVNPAVVSIISTELVDPNKGGQNFHGPFEFFFGPGQDRKRPEKGEPHREDSGGSGFLISQDGYILTNNHVIEGADRIRVNLEGDETDYKAEVIGTDPSTDLALIKITADHNLPAVPLGDSDSLRVGEWVIAVGNPYYYEHTVTVGVVSAKGRKLPDLSKDYSMDEFIQTDAAINFGNSGGPLLNANGEVIGVNSAISSVGQGIGFAVPINTAKAILSQLKTTGHVSRGYLGIRLRNVSADLKEAFNLKDTKGALVEEVERGLPGERAGLKPGDVIIGVDGKNVGTTDELVKVISAREPGSRVRLNLMRDGRPVLVTARLEDRGQYMNAKNRTQDRGEDGDNQKDEGERRLGITVDNLGQDIRRQLDLDETVTGVIVTEVSQASEAFEQGIVRGQIITSVNRVPVGSLSEYRREMAKARPGSRVLFRIYDPRNGGRWSFVVVKNEE